MRRLHERPIAVALVGAFTIAFSSIFFRLSHASPSTGAFFRCTLALPPLLVLAELEDRRYGGRGRRARALAMLAGFFFALDLQCWHHGILEVGAGLATVLANLQVILVGPVAWLVLRERPRTRVLAAMPIALCGVILISGVVGSGEYGRNPMLGAVFGLGTGFAYAGFLFTLRQSSSDLRRFAGPLCDATIAAALASTLIGLAVGDLDFGPPLHTLAWLAALALGSQFFGWLVISFSLPRLSAAHGSVLLTVQPVMSVLFAEPILGERPSPLQLAGVALVVGGVLTASIGRREPIPEPALAE
jgi:drug/metabolite transporter (DMT)-like permease